MPKSIRARSSNNDNSVPTSNPAGHDTTFANQLKQLVSASVVYTKDVILAAIKEDYVPETSNENGKVNPGRAAGGPILTPALIIPEGRTPPKMLIPGFVRTPADANCERDSLDKSGVPTVTFANFPAVALNILYESS